MASELCQTIKDTFTCEYVYNIINTMFFLYNKWK